MKRVLSNKWHIMVFVLPTLLFFTFIVVIPIIMSIGYSVIDWSTDTNIHPSLENFVGLQNYIDLFTSRRPNFMNAMKNTMIYAGASLFIQLPFSLLLALILASGVKGESMYRNFFFIPVIISSVVISILWLRIYDADYGILNMLLRAIGLESVIPPKGWIGEKTTKLWAVFIPNLWQFVGYHMLLMYGALRSISPDIIEAARVDGATGARLAVRIQVPLIKPMLKVCLSFSLIGSFKLFDTPYIMLGRSITNAELPAITMYQFSFMQHKYGVGSANAMFIVAECLAFTLLLNLVFRERKEKAGRRLPA